MINRYPRNYPLRIDEGMWTRLRFLNKRLGGSFASTLRMALLAGIDQLSKKGS